MKIFITISFFLFTCASHAQDLPVRTTEQLEGMAERTESVPEDDQLVQQLEYYRNHPLNLNEADEKDLQALGFLNELQVHHLLHYRHVLGKFLSIYELQAVPALDLHTIRKLLPFVFVGPSTTMKEDLRTRLKGTHQLLGRWATTLEKSEGYLRDSMNRYLGAPYQLMLRYRYQYKNLFYYGCTAEKDAGEPLNKGFDFFSAHIFLQRWGPFKMLALGDYTVNLGQGLIQWQAMGFGKSSEVLQIRQQGQVLRPYRAAGEIFFNRGFGFTMGKRKWETTLFFSSRKYSGNLSHDSQEVFSSWQLSGYHRTPGEIADRKKIKVLTSGMAARYKQRSWEVGINGIGHWFSHYYQKGNAPYAQYQLKGNRWWNASVDYACTFRNLHVFGEAATGLNTAKALLQGLLLGLDPKMELSLLFRFMERDYNALWAGSFMESSAPGNETGLFLGLAIRPKYGWSLQGYADLYSFPWLRYRIHAPVSGSDYRVQLGYSPDKKTELFLLFRFEAKPLNVAGSAIAFPENVVRIGLRFHVSRILDSTWTLRSRVEASWIRQGLKKEAGFLAYLEGLWTSRKKFRGNARLEWFETGSYDSRVYAYEQDVRYGYSIPALFGKGCRTYINIYYQPRKNWGLWLKLARTVYDQGPVGSGLDEIRGSHKTEMRFQWEYRF